MAGVGRLMGVVLLFLLAGCTHVSVEDCPPHGVIGNNEAGTARLRSSHYRVVLADTAAAAARFLPYAIMSAYAYKIDRGCEDEGDEKRVTPEREALLLAWLAGATDRAQSWQLLGTGGLQDGRLSSASRCEDDLGLMLHVWHRKVDGQEQVVIAFRGTNGHGDWKYGNFWWISRALVPETQFSHARERVTEIIRYFDRQALAEGAPAPRYLSTGHSLGGGLAQHVLYAFPDKVEQAIVFSPSSVTGFVDPAISDEDRVDACSCRRALDPEARIIRVYQTYEILANLRIFHKIILPPERHVQEVRFPFKSSWNPVARHGMFDFTSKLQVASARYKADEVRHRWFASRDEACTGPLIERQHASCSVAVAPGAVSLCPQ